MGRGQLIAASGKCQVEQLRCDLFWPCAYRSHFDEAGFQTEPFVQHVPENGFPLACWEVNGLRLGSRLVLKF
jgi:hypothetical protein